MLQGLIQVEYIDLFYLHYEKLIVLNITRDNFFTKITQGCHNI